MLPKIAPKTREYLGFFLQISRVLVGREYSLAASTRRGTILVSTWHDSKYLVCYTEKTGRPGGVSGYPRDWYRSVS